MAEFIEQSAARPETRKGAGQRKIVSDIPEIGLFKSDLFKSES